MSKTTQRSQARKLWLRIHFYLGMIFGIFFVLAGFTGSLLAFYIEIDELLNPELVLTDEQLSQKKQSYEQIFQALVKSHPERQHAWRMEIPDSPQRMITARYYQPVEKSHLAFAPLMVWINPYSSEVVSSRFWGEFAMTWIYDLHYTLLSDMKGRLVLSVIGLWIVISLVIGLYLWWPSKKGLRSAISLKKHTSQQRQNYDWHKLSGLYGGVVLLVIVSTGALLDYPSLKLWVNGISPLFQPKYMWSSKVGGAQRLPVDEVLEQAQILFPDATIKWIETPDGESGSYRINLRQAGEPSLRFPKTNVWLDQYSGQIIAVRDVHFDSAGDTFLRWLHPLHSGEAFGLPGRILVFISGFLPLILFVTGIRHWLYKRRVRKS